jgi:hypothetical protein
MKLIPFSAAALVLSGFAVASETDYSSLDRDIEALVSGRLTDNAGPNISGYVQVRYQNSSDLPGEADPATTNDLGGFNIPRARVSFKGEREGYGYKVQVDFTNGSSLKDAYVSIPVGEHSIRVGILHTGISRNGMNSSSKLFFIDRSEIGNLFDNRDTGAVFRGNFEKLALFLSLTNGTDGTGDELMSAVRVAFDFMGAGVGKVEGAYGGADEMGGTVAAAIYDDGEATDGSAVLIEAHVASSQFSAGLELFDADKLGVSAAPGSSMAVDDATAMTLYGTYMLTPDQWELGVRFQDLDDADDTTVMDLGVNRYLDGHKLKYSIGYRSISSDLAVNEADILQVQLQVAF